MEIIELFALFMFFRYAHAQENSLHQKIQVGKSKQKQKKEKKRKKPHLFSLLITLLVKQKLA